MSAASEASPVAGESTAELVEVESIVASSDPGNTRKLYSRNLAYCKQILHLAGENKRCHDFITEKLAQLEQDVEEFIRSENPSASSSTDIVDVVHVPREPGPPSSRRTKFAYETQRSTTKKASIHRSKLQQSRMVDILGSQKGGRKKLA